MKNMHIFDRLRLLPLATMLLCLASPLRAETAQNAFVIVEGEGVVRLDGRNFAVLSEGSRQQDGRWNLAASSERADFYAVKDSLYVEGVEAGSCDVEFRFEVKDKSISDMVRYTFIAADCGDQPTSDRRSFWEGFCPRLVGCEWSVLAPCDARYNCIAWSVGENNEIISPCSSAGFGDIYIDDAYGNRDGEISDDEIVAFYLNHGFKQVSSIYEADVVYHSEIHASRKSPCTCGSGKWIMYQSKCGKLELIEHRLGHVNNPIYGIPRLFFAKKED